MHEAPQRSGHAGVKGAYREGRQLGVDRAYAYDLGGDIHVAHRHPRAADMATHQVLGQEREHDHDRQHHQVFFDRGVDRPAQHVDLRGRHRPRRRIVGEPFDPREHPVDEELRRQRRHAQVQALDLQRRQAEHGADERSDETGEHQHDDEIELRKMHHQVVGRIGPDRHERGVAQRNLAAITDQEVEPDGGQRDDEEGDQDGAEHIVRRHIRYDEEGECNQSEDEPAILPDAQDLLIFPIAGLELAVFAIEHGVGSLTRGRCASRRTIPRA